MIIVFFFFMFVGTIQTSNVCVACQLMICFCFWLCAVETVANCTHVATCGIDIMITAWSVSQ